MAFIADMFGGGSAPSAPNPSVVAGAQASANEDAARLNAKLNRVNTYMPTGSVTYSNNGDTWTAQQTLAPEQQKLYDRKLDAANVLTGIAGGKARQIDGTRFSLSDLPDYQSSISYDGLMDVPTADSLDTYAQHAEDAAFNRVWSRMSDQFGDERSALESKLANQGITSGSDAYNQEMERFTNRMDDARTNAAYDAVSQGSALRSSLLADALTGRQQGISERTMDMNLANQGRGQAINDRLMERQQPLNEIAALLGGAPGFGQPSPMPTAQTNVAAPDVTGAYAMQNAAQQNAYAQRQASANAGMGGLFGLGAAGINAIWG